MVFPVLDELLIRLAVLSIYLDQDQGLKRNFQLMPGAQWLVMLCRHIPEPFEHLVRYFGWCSNRVRAMRARTNDHSPVDQEPQDRNGVAARARS